MPCQHTRELVQPEPKKLEPAGELFARPPINAVSLRLAILQASHPARMPTAVSPRTCGFASPAARSVAAGSSTVAAAATATP